MVELNIKLHIQDKEELQKYRERLCLTIICVEKISCVTDQNCLQLATDGVMGAGTQEI